jgi:hypothetical protein
MVGPMPTLGLRFVCLGIAASSLVLLHCSTDSGNAGGSGGSGGVEFMCGDSSQQLFCDPKSEICRIQDAANGTTFTCVAITQGCDMTDPCSCTTLKPGCTLGDGPGAFTCTADSNGAVTVSCPG